jgi:hypothetical protein
LHIGLGVLAPLVAVLVGSKCHGLDGVRLIYARICKGAMTMEQAMFDDLVQSLKEAKAIAHGQTPASRRIKVTPPDV